MPRVVKSFTVSSRGSAIRKLFVDKNVSKKEKNEVLNKVLNFIRKYWTRVRKERLRHDTQLYHTYVLVSKKFSKGVHGLQGETRWTTWTNNDIEIQIVSIMYYTNTSSSSFFT